MRKLLLLALFGLSACVGLVPDAPPGSATGAAGSSSREAVESRAGSAAAVHELVTSSRSFRAGGDHAHALADIERAIRIEPRNPWLWLELGEIHLSQADPRQAAAMARKAMSLAGADEVARAAAERLLEQASW